MNPTFTTFGKDTSDVRREELIRIISHALEHLSTTELEAVYYDLLTKDYIRG